MKSRELERQKTVLLSLFNRTTVATNGDIEMQSHWAKYLCVLSAGFIENSLVEVYTRYCQSCTNSKVSNFARQKLSKIQNPKSSRFLEVAGSFDSVWKQSLEAFFDQDGRKEAINSIMTNRHNIAHGKTSNITLVRVKEYLLKSIEVIEFVENECGVAQQ